MENEDHTLIKRALVGDEEAYKRLLEKYRGPLYGLLYKMVRNREEAEDLVQEAFIKAFSALANFREEFAFSTWLYKIAINNCIDHLRKKKLATYSLDRPVVMREGDVKRDYPDFSSSPELTLIAKEKIRLIEEAINSLPERYRIVIVLRHSEDKPYEEIAQILGIPLGTVKARLFRAREMLKKKLKGKL